MSDADIVIHRRQMDNTLTKLSLKLKQPDLTGTVAVVSLAGKTPKFLMLNAATQKVVIAETDTNLNVTDEAEGELDYDFSAEGVIQPGIYYGYVNVYSGSEYDTLPVDTGYLQIHISSLTMTAEEAYRLQLKYAAKDTIVLTLNDKSEGFLTNFPETLKVGDSYIEALQNHMQIYIRNPSRTPLTGVGTKNFADGDFEATLTVSQDNASSIVRGTCTWVPAVGATEGYLKCEIPRDQTRRAGEGTARLQLVFKWGSSVEILTAFQSVTWLNKNIRT